MNCSSNNQKKTICIFAYSFLYEKKFIKKKLNSRSFAHFNKCYIEFKVLRCSETMWFLSGFQLNCSRESVGVDCWGSHTIWFYILFLTKITHSTIPLYGKCHCDTTILIREGTGNYLTLFRLSIDFRLMLSTFDLGGHMVRF